MSNETKTIEVVDIQFRPNQKVYFFDPAGAVYAAGDHVIMDTARGPEYGYCTAGNHPIKESEVVSPLRPVLRKATAKDEEKAAANRAKEQKAYTLCLEQIEALQLDMQLVSAECSFDGTKILFFFTADDRVDFRELVKILANTLHCRIELRQIGVRDKAKMVGGLGICGRPFCCGTFLEEFVPVSIKMAKTQNLSLNPTKISGTCGRLMCCLKYEQEAYEDLHKTSPKPDSFVDTPDGRGTVVEVNLLRQKVRVRMEENPDTFGLYRNDEIAVLRSGKAKKTDPPIPADLAPISGAGKRRKLERLEPSKPQPALDAIRFRYSEETIAEEESLPVGRGLAPADGDNDPKAERGLAPADGDTQQPAADAEKTTAKHNRRHHRHRRGGNRPDSAKSPTVGGDDHIAPQKSPAVGGDDHIAPQKNQKAGRAADGDAQPATENAQGEAKKRRPYRRFHHRRRTNNAGKQEG